MTSTAKIESASLFAALYSTAAYSNLAANVVHAAVALESSPLVAGRFARQAGEVLCNRKWVADEAFEAGATSAPVSCPRCLEIMAKHGLAVNA